MRKSPFAQLWCVFEPLVAECRQFLGMSNLMGKNESHHCSTASLRPYCLHFQSAVLLADIKERLDDLHLLTDSLPIKQMLVFCRGKMKQNPIIGFYAVYEHIGQSVLPKLIDGLVACSFKCYAVLHAIWYDTVHRTEQAIEEARYPKMSLGVLQRLVTQ